MARWQIAYNWMMDNEDSRRAYAVVPDPTGDDPNAQAISGVNSAAWPESFALIAAASLDDRPELVETFYHAHFWNQWYAQLDSDDVAKRVFDAAINMGPETAVKLLQAAVNSFHEGNPLTVDGDWGPLTVAATNAVNPATLAAAFREQRAARYKAIADVHPATLESWLKRAEK